MELLPHDAVEKILERLPVKSLIRFKSVSKQWKSTMESQYFQAKQLIFDVKPVRDVLLVSKELKTMVLPHDHHIGASPPRTLVLKSSSSLSSPPYYSVCQTSCDGLVCLNAYLKSSIVLNPTTQWHRTLPLSRLQQYTLERHISGENNAYPFPKLGFGKDKISDTYKPVSLYNSSEFGLENATTCEVFDFSTNSWRCITSSSPYRVIASLQPLYLDGSLYWLTEGEETKVLSLDLHTETFQVISEAPFVQAAPTDIIICNLNNCLRVSVSNRPQQAIWSFNSENKTWEHIYSLVDIYFHFSPLAILEENKLLFYVRVFGTRLKIYDPKTESFVSVYRDPFYSRILVCYVKSLISIL